MSKSKPSIKYTSRDYTSIKSAIIQTIENYEPRAKIIDVIVSPYPDDNGYVVTLLFYITTIANPITVNIPLIRVR